MTHDARSAVQNSSQYRLVEALELLRQVRDCGQDVRGTALMARIQTFIQHVPAGYNLPNPDLRRRVDEAERSF